MAGLWGVELDGELVALVSDIGLHHGWAPTQDPARVASGTWLSAFSDLHTAHIDAADMQDGHEDLLLPLGGDP